ncbi:UNVERIFIED_CONTAM: Alanine--glyoxylate aminotransferase 22, mitochondrial [Sesamum calycinum]|uniref:Alanine--glyoxylate aminotransferase 22, mitochondrial n=1 Tax=Sesamum calycinum TaxID=2727403 RepID=A0AAW2SBN9_9LAMI
MNTKIHEFHLHLLHVHHAQNPDQYRGVFGSDGPKYARDVDEIITYGTSGHVAGFIAEAIQGVGGIMELAPGYLPAVYDSIRKAGGLCIADEGIGNGIPLGAVVTTPEIAKVLACRNYYNTYGGNPVCTAAGLAVLKVIEKQKLQQNAFNVGLYLKQRLNSLKDKYEIIGDVRGRGLLVGVELVTDRQLKTPAKIETLRVMEQMKGVILAPIYVNVPR